MVKITGEYQGDYHCVAKHEPSGNELGTDAPKDNQGRGEAFSPTDLVATALITCIATTMAIVAKRGELEIKGAKFEVTKEMSTDAPRRIVRLASQIWLPVAKDHPLAGKLEHAALHCPVHNSLGTGVDMPVTIHWAS